MKFLKPLGLLLVALGAVAMLTEMFGFPLFIYYGDPLGGVIGFFVILTGTIMLTVHHLAGAVGGLNPIEIYIKFMNTFSDYIGAGIGWLTTVMVVIIFTNVVLRYLYGQSFLQLQDLSWYLFGTVFMIGAAYTLKDDRHVRVDVVYANYKPRTRVWINLLGMIFFLIPFCVLGIFVSWDFVARSFAIQETSPDAAGLAARYLAKMMIPTGFVLILLQGIAMMFESILQLQGKMEIPETTEAAH